MSNLVHGLSASSEYSAWKAMIQRCTNVNNAQVIRYGGRGITVCDRWLNSFEAFYLDMGPKPTQEHSLDRRNNDGNYEPGNCRWATDTEQQRNKSNNRLVDYDGRKVTVAELSELTGISEAVLHYRLNSGIVGDAFTKEVCKQYTYGGITDTFPGWAKRLGINRMTMYRRLEVEGWSTEKAFNTPVRTALEYTHNNQSHTLEQWAAISGINVRTLKSRIQERGWSIEKSLTTPIP
jgi:hypothetical protein